MAISPNRARRWVPAGTNGFMDVAAALDDPELVDALDAAALDADAIHHDLCTGSAIAGGRCSCGVPSLIQELRRICNSPDTPKGDIGSTGGEISATVEVVSGAKAAATSLSESRRRRN